MKLLKAVFVGIGLLAITGCASGKQYQKLNALIGELKANDCAIVQAAISAANPSAGTAIRTVDPDCTVGRAYLDFLQGEIRKLSK